MADDVDGGLAIEIRGGAGAGKSTLAAALAAYIEGNGYRVSFEAEAEASQVLALHQQWKDLPGLGRPSDGRTVAVSIRARVDF